MKVVSGNPSPQYKCTLRKNKVPNTLNNMNKISLKKPIVVYLIAIAFLLSPFVNFWLSTRNLETVNPVSTFDLIGHMKTTDVILNILIFLAGALLFKTHKLTWAFAVLCLGIVTVFNVIFLINQSGASQGVSGQIWMSITATVAGWVILYYARFPYLDRRDTWTGTAVRFEVKIPVEIEGHGEHIIDNLSLTGARISLKTPLKLEISAPVSLKFKEAGGHPIEGRAVGYDGNQILRIEFKKTSKDYKEFIKQLKSQTRT